MFQRIIFGVLDSPAGRRFLEGIVRSQIERNVRELLEDPNSGTRRGMMRIIRGIAKDVIEDANERGQALAELDTEYVQWSQQRREALLEQQNREKAALAAYVRTGETPAVVDLLAGYQTGRRVRVISDALFENKYGKVLGFGTLPSGFPEVTVLLDHHQQPVTFTPSALQLLDDVQDAEQAAATELLPRVEP